MKRGTFGGFSAEMMQLVIAGIWNKADYAPKDSQKMEGKFEESSYSKVIQSVLNGRTFKYHFGGGRFYMLLQSYRLLTDFVWIIYFKFD